MQDIIFLLVTAVFLLVSWLYVRACDSISGGK